MNFKLKFIILILTSTTPWSIFYGGNPLHYTSPLLLFLPFIHFFSFWIFITRQCFIAFNPMFMWGFTSFFKIDFLFLISYFNIEFVKNWAFYFYFFLIWWFWSFDSSHGYGMLTHIDIGLFFYFLYTDFYFLIASFNIAFIED